MHGKDDVRWRRLSKLYYSASKHSFSKSVGPTVNLKLKYDVWIGLMLVVSNCFPQFFIVDIFQIVSITRYHLPC